MRIFAETSDPSLNIALVQSMSERIMQHFSGFHNSLDMRTALPKPFLAFYPALYSQSDLKCSVTLLSADGKSERSEQTTPPPQTEALEKRSSYDTMDPVSIEQFQPTRITRLGDIALARSGDKGPNLNIGIFVRKLAHWDWLRSFLTRARMAELLGEDWKEDEYYIERVEFPNIWAVHFVVYGILGRGVSSSSRLDALGKGVADFVRDVWVPVPERFLKDIQYFGAVRKEWNY